MNIDKTISGLSKGSKDALCGMNGEWQELDHIGLFIYAGYMKALLNRGLVEKGRAKVRGKVSYCATKLGLAVKKAIIAAKK